jgi:hypothetical protein
MVPSFPAADLITEGTENIDCPSASYYRPGAQAIGAGSRSPAAAADGITYNLVRRIAGVVAECLAFKLRQLASKGVAMLSGCAEGAKSY